MPARIDLEPKLVEEALGEIVVTEPSPSRTGAMENGLDASNCIRPCISKVESGIVVDDVIQHTLLSRVASVHDPAPACTPRMKSGWTSPPMYTTVTRCAISP